MGLVNCNNTCLMHSKTGQVPSLGNMAVKYCSQPLISRTKTTPKDHHGPCCIRRSRGDRLLRDMATARSRQSPFQRSSPLRTNLPFRKKQPLPELCCRESGDQPCLSVHRPPSLAAAAQESTAAAVTVPKFGASLPPQAPWQSWLELLLLPPAVRLSAPQ